MYFVIVLTYFKKFNLCDIAVRLILPNFEFKYDKLAVDESTPPDIATVVNNSLTAGLKLANNLASNDGVSFYDKNLLRKNSLLQGFHRQLSDETNVLVSVPSIQVMTRTASITSESHSKLRKLILDDFEEKISKQLIKAVALVQASPQILQNRWLSAFLTALPPADYVDMMLK